MRSGATDQSLSRHAAVKADPSNTVDLRPDHPALSEARTLFPSTVIDPSLSPRLLVGGHNNPKLGKEVRKGPWRGFPIYHLTLEERATCPASCAAWASCYGNSMHLARRHGHGARLERRLVDEVAAAQERHPGGFVIRLHTLGDFYSVPYVRLWEQMLDANPALHVFGYTARNFVMDNEESHAIAEAVFDLADRRWDRFAIRFSRPGGGPQGTMIVDEDPRRPDVIVCPAQTGGTTACATCGLCWSLAARNKAVAFLRHGMIRTRTPRGTVPKVKRRGRTWSVSRPAAESPITPALIRLAESGDSIAVRALARKRAAAS